MAQVVDNAFWLYLKVVRHLVRRRRRQVFYLIALKNCRDSGLAAVIFSTRVSSRWSSWDISRGPVKALALALGEGGGGTAHVTDDT